MATKSAGEFRNGMTLEIEGKVCQVIDFMHVKPGKGAAFVRVKLKDIINGGVVETTYRPTESFQEAFIESIFIMMEIFIISWIMKHMIRLQ